MKIKLLIIAALSFFISSNALPSSEEVVILSKDNLLVLRDIVHAESVSSIMTRAAILDAQLLSSHKPMYLYLDTPGGDVVQGLRLIDFLNGLSRPTHTVTVFAASMGFQIVQHLGDRLIVPHGIMMSHRARGGVEGEFGGVSPSQLESRLNVWLNIVKHMDEQTVKRTKGKQTLDSYQKSYVPELWRSGEDSVKDGYSDRIVAIRCDSSLNGFTEKSVSLMGIVLKFKTSMCPLNTGISDIGAELKTTQGLMDINTFVNNGGSFSSECLTMFATNPNKLCSLDTTLDVNKVLKIREQFIETYSTVDLRPLGRE